MVSTIRLRGIFLQVFPFRLRRLATASNVGMMKYFVQKVKDIIEEFAMIQAADSVLVAVSGGPDSVALLHALIELSEDYPLRLGVAHLNHGLRRNAADRDAEFVAQLADRNGLPAYIRKEDIYQHRRRMSVSLEEAARMIRYDYLLQVADTHGYHKIALGHHADDNAESVLMYIIRGSGLSGISGIAPVRGRFIRPLIRLTKSEILDYLTVKGVDFVLDHSNDDMTYDRNRIRHHLLPMLRRDFNPNISGALNRLAEISRDEERWLRDELLSLINQCRIETTTDGVRLSAHILSNLNVAAARRIVRKAIDEIKGDTRRINFKHINAVICLAQPKMTASSIDLPDRIRVYRQGGVLTICKEPVPLRQQHPAKNLFPEVVYRYSIPQPDADSVVITIKEMALKLSFSTLSITQVPNIRSAGQTLAFFDMNRLSFPLTLRNIRSGDRFRPLGASGRQKVKKFFIDHKVPRLQRSGCPILISQQNTVWLIGHRIDEFAKIRSSTRRVLKVEVWLA